MTHALVFHDGLGSYPPHKTVFILGNDSPLGLYSPRATSVTVDVHGQTLTLRQSPALLHAPLACGTTGAMLWNITPRLARFLTSPPRPARSPARPSPPSSSSIAAQLLPPSARVLELGCGVTALLACTIGPRVAAYLQSDMHYAAKLAEENLRSNLPRPSPGVRTITLDWEEDHVASQPALRALGAPLTAVIACDCVYNEALVEPLVDTLAAACRLHRLPPLPSSGAEQGGEGRDGTTVIVASELRSPDVHECFLDALMARFDVWRVPADCLPADLQPTDGFVVYVGLLKDTE